MPRKFFFILASAFIFLNCSAQQPESNWYLVWADEFNSGNIPDPEIWDYEEGYIRNKESQYYTVARSENARIENGCLVIEARADNWNGKPITSASLHTWNKREILYGRIEVKAKLPTGIGTWPAIWMLGTNRKQVGWPSCGEIDIMENVGYDPKTIHANIHTKAYNHSIGTGKGSKIALEQPWNDFHVYSIEWYDDRIDFFVDDRKYFTYTNDGAGWESWPFDKPHYLIINLAIGGAWGGKNGIADDLLPQKYYIDYVRVYRKK